MFVQVTDLNSNEIRVNMGLVAYYYYRDDTEGATVLRWTDGTVSPVHQSVEALDQALKVWKTVKEEK